MSKQAEAAQFTVGPYEGPPFREGDFEGVVRWFAAGWDSPGSAERFSAHFIPGFHERIRLIQPGAPTAIGHEGARAQFRALFDLFPGLRADVHRWAGKGEVLFIEFTLSDPSVSWRAMDRFTLEDGLLVERRSFFDPMPSRLAVLRRPATWPRAARLLRGSLRQR
jgi:hypothetical protein